MKNMVMALAASAVIALAPVSAAMAETAAPAKEADAVAKAWVPATKAEQQDARGGGGNYLFYNLQNTFCNNVTIRIFFCNNKG